MTHIGSGSLSLGEKYIIVTLIIVTTFVYSFAASPSSHSIIITIANAQMAQTITSRNLIIDLGNGTKTNGQLMLPGVGKGPFPGVLLISGSGLFDMTNIYQKPSSQIAQYLSQRGFAVLTYNKRGLDTNDSSPITIGNSIYALNGNITSNTTLNQLKQDAEKALAILIQQPEVDPKRISIIDRSEGTIIAPRVATDTSLTKIKNIILMGTVAENFSKIMYFQFVSIPLSYAKEILDHNQSGLISLEEAAKDPVFQYVTMVTSINTGGRINSTALLSQLANDIGTAKDKQGKSNYISIDKELKPFLIKNLESIIFGNLPGKCIIQCPAWIRSEFRLSPNLSIIGNISSSVGILILNGENDSQTPVQEALFLQQRLTQVSHPDHTLIAYPGLGHLFYPSSQWITSSGPIEQYVLADIYGWLEAHSGFTGEYIKMPSSSSCSSSSSPC